ncbi:MAG: enoyl-CoA hydratase/isomerase family protein, partial [Alphaproteobacteria bacterium]|nr:enoyl-CoA hydratase/isomerase family protein [Alphaproteobacteria bacterium]
DFTAILGSRDWTIEQMRPELDAFADCLECLLSAARPTFAVVRGPALGGGLGLVAACDFVLSTDRAVFGLPEALYGMTPAIIRPALRTRMTEQQLNLLAFTGFARSAAEAERLGLVDQIIDEREVETAARAAARRLARASSDSVRAMRALRVSSISDSIRQGVAETLAALARDDVRNALRASVSGEEVPWER